MNYNVNSRYKRGVIITSQNMLDLVPLLRIYLWSGLTGLTFIFFWAFISINFTSK